MVKDYRAVVPTAVAHMVVDDPVRRGEFVEGQGEAADEYNGDAYAVCYPAEPAGQADKEVGMI